MPITPQPNVNRRALEAELQRRVRGEVRFDAGSRALYATDSSNYRQPPIGVVLPRDAEDVVAAASACKAFGAPLLTRGGGTSLAGQCCNVAVVLDTSKYMNRILELDAEGRRARVQPGVVLDVLRAAAEKHHLTFAPDPSTHSRCTLGGMIGNNSCGTHSLMGGNTVDNVESLEVLTYDGLRLRVGATEAAEVDRLIEAGGRTGALYSGLRQLGAEYGEEIRSRFPRIPRRISGYNLDQLLPENGFHVARALTGTEGTCVTILEATLRLVESPVARPLLALGYADMIAAAEQVMRILPSRPIALEGVDGGIVKYLERTGHLVEQISLLPPGNAWLLAEFGASNGEEAAGRARELMDRLSAAPGAPSMRLFEDAGQARSIWAVREAGLAATARGEGGKEFFPGWEDAAVPPERLADYLRDFRHLMASFGYGGSLYGHFGQACIHLRIDFDFKSAEGISKFRNFMQAAADLVVRYGGSLSGEHGDGQARAELYPRMFGDRLTGAFRQFKTLWDPGGRMNPGKMVDAYRMDENLRTGPGFRPPAVKTHFGYPEDGGSFISAALRCVGVSACRQDRPGIMCPSFRATREEAQSTRGRARLLFEMLQGEVIRGGWRSTEVRRALDLCLACKACKSECPAGVDMATYKAEFLAHYYRGRVRPRAAYAFGHIGDWAPWAARAHWLVNAFTQAPMLRQVAKAVAGIAPERQIPVVASRSFQSWFSRRAVVNQGRPPVLLWADTFNNYFTPQVAIAGVEALEAAGFCVRVLEQTVCCGRPYYDYGLLQAARRALRRVMEATAPYMEQGVPVVGLEPSCVSVLREELPNLFPADPRARRLASQAFMFSEFLTRQPSPVALPRLPRRALVHGHCHHKSVLDFSSEQRLLSGLGLQLEILDAGCCGMAGGFGFEKDHYAVSRQIAELGLLPAVRNAAPDTLLIADGFSCREQVWQLAGKRPLHAAEAIALALRNAAQGHGM
jgi:FAD/FMN-containing dehydrogenase/Fe-S oxidoreductase